MPPLPSDSRGPRRPIGSPPPRDGDTERRILAAARAVFVRKGTSGARVQDIAAEAGVNQALVHYYFGSKDVLAERVFLDAASEIIGGFAPVPDPTLSLQAMIERFVRGYIEAVRRAPFIPAYLLAEAHHHPQRLDALMEAAIGTIPAAIARETLVHVEAR
ncbi:MAG: TetR/AcrR family transcriptional regulator, partial [Gemmatimonadaceae bacterium]|nr:TetR/AcrR family transcriptional regulator [Gemmatimonadaceae bacterium]